MRRPPLAPWLQKVAWSEARTIGVKVRPFYKCGYTDFLLLGWADRLEHPKALNDGSEPKVWRQRTLPRCSQRPTTTRVSKMEAFGQKRPAHWSATPLSVSKK